MDPESRCWKRMVTPYEMLGWHYKKPLAFSEYVESMPKDFCQATFERVIGVDWLGVREKVYHWSLRPGVCCRHWYDYVKFVAQVVYRKCWTLVAVLTILKLQ